MTTINKRVWTKSQRINDLRVRVLVGLWWKFKKSANVQIQRDVSNKLQTVLLLSAIVIISAIVLVIQTINSLYNYLILLVVDSFICFTNPLFSLNSKFPKF